MNRTENNNLAIPANENYKKDIERTFQYTRYFLTFLGVWSLLSESPNKLKISQNKVISRVKSLIFVFKVAIILFMIAFTIVPGGLQMLFFETNPKKRMILIGPITSTTVSLIKYVIMMLHADTIRTCIEKMRRDWRNVHEEKERAIMKKNVTVGRGITVICSTFLYTGGMFYHAVMPILKGPKINQFNVTIRPLVYTGYDIFVDSQASPNYEIIFCLTCVSGFVRYTITITICNLASTFACHVCGEIDIVVLRLNNILDHIDETQDVEKIKKNIAMVVQCHVGGLRLCSKINEGLKEIFLIEVLASTMLICLLEYYCMTEWSNADVVAMITYCILLTSYVFNIFMLCYIGELLKAQFDNVGKVAYMIDWYRLPDKNARAIILIMAMSKYPLQLNAGKMMELSVCSFGDIMRTTLVYLNMLRSVSG